MLAVELLVGSGLLDGEFAGFLVIGAGGLEGARAALIELVDGAAQVILKLLLVKGIGEHGQVDVLIQVDRAVLGGAIGFSAERRDEARWPQQRLVFADNLVGGFLAIDDGIVGLGLVGPAKVVARHGELVVLPCRVDLGGCRRCVRERDVDAGDGGVGVSDLRERHDAYDVDDCYEAEDYKEGRLSARRAAFAGALVRGPAIVCRASVRRALRGGATLCGTLLILLMRLVLTLIRALRGIGRAVLLAANRRDGARRLDAASMPTGLLRIGNHVAAVDLRHRIYFLRVSPYGSSCFNWACIIAITCCLWCGNGIGLEKSTYPHTPHLAQAESAAGA